MLVAGGSTDVTTYFALRLSADGKAATGLTITGIDLQYVRSGVAPVAKVDATALAATDSAHADNKAIEIDATDQPGLYRVDWPDPAFAAGVREVILSVKVATAFTEHLRVEIDGEVNVVEFGGTDVVLSGGLPDVNIGITDDIDLSATQKTSVNTEADTALTDYNAATTADLLDKLGAVNEAAAAGDPSTTESVMQYVKQIVNILVGADGIVTFPAEAAPGNAVSLAEVIRAIHADVTGLAGSAMVGTNSAALASVCTDTRLSELDAGTAGKAANQIDEIRTDTGEIGTAGAGLTDLGGMATGMKAEVNVEVVDVLKTDTISELAHAAPVATPTFEDALMLLYMTLRNKIDITSSVKEIHNDAGTVIAKKGTHR